MFRPSPHPLAALLCSDALVVFALSRVASNRASGPPPAVDAAHVCRSLVVPEARL